MPPLFCSLRFAIGEQQSSLRVQATTALTLRPAIMRFVLRKANTGQTLTFDHDENCCVYTLWDDLLKGGAVSVGYMVILGWKTR